MASRLYPWLSFKAGVDWKNVDPALLRGLNDLGRSKRQTITVTSGKRSYEEQARLYERYKRSGFNIKFIAAKPGHSRHESGNAVDAVVGGTPIANAFSAKDLAAVGLATPVKGDLVHVQLLGASQPASDTVVSQEAPAAQPAAGATAEVPTVAPPQMVAPPTALGVSSIGAELPGSVDFVIQPRQVAETWRSLASDPFSSPETKEWAARAALAAGG